MIRLNHPKALLISATTEAAIYQGEDAMSQSPEGSSYLCNYFRQKFYQEQVPVSITRRLFLSLQLRTDGLSSTVSTPRLNHPKALLISATSVFRHKGRSRKVVSITRRLFLSLQLTDRLTQVIRQIVSITRRLFLSLQPPRARSRDPHQASLNHPKALLISATERDHRGGELVGKSQSPEGSSYLCNPLASDCIPSSKTSLNHPKALLISATAPFPCHSWWISAVLFARPSLVRA